MATSPFHSLLLLRLLLKSGLSLYKYIFFKKRAASSCCSCYCCGCCRSTAAALSPPPPLKRTEASISYFGSPHHHNSLSVHFTSLPSRLKITDHTPARCVWAPPIIITSYKTHPHPPAHSRGAARRTDAPHPPAFTLIYHINQPSGGGPNPSLGPTNSINQSMTDRRPLVGKNPSSYRPPSSPPQSINHPPPFSPPHIVIIIGLTGRPRRPRPSNRAWSARARR